MGTPFGIHARGLHVSCFPLLGVTSSRAVSATQHLCEVSETESATLKGSQDSTAGYVGNGVSINISNPSSVHQSPLIRAARSSEGHDVIIRVVKIGKQGQQHLQILRKLARGDQALFSNNHALPMFEELSIDDVTFGVFPKAGYPLVYAYGLWAKNSVGDVLDMIMQALEVCAYSMKVYRAL